MECNRYVVGVDGSASSESALEWAIDVAAREEAALEVVTAVAGRSLVCVGEPPIRRERWLSTSEASHMQTHLVNVAVARAPRLPGRLNTAVVSGDPVGVLTEVARGAHALIVGRDHRGALVRKVLGSVTDECVRAAATPVVVVPTATAQLAGPVVAAVDGSANSIVALAIAYAEAAKRAASLAIVHAVEPAPGAAADPETRAKEAHWMLVGMLQRLEATAQLAPRRVYIRVRDEMPATALTQMTAKASLLVLGHRGTAETQALGSVTRRCLRHAACPVMVVKESALVAGQPLLDAAADAR